jgi:hypothetical protein
MSTYKESIGMKHDLIDLGGYGKKPTVCCDKGK